MKKYIIEDIVDFVNGKYTDKNYRGTDDINNAKLYESYNDVRQELDEIFDTPEDFKITEVEVNESGITICNVTKEDIIMLLDEVIKNDIPFWELDKGYLKEGLDDKEQKEWATNCINTAIEIIKEHYK